MRYSFCQSLFHEVRCTPRCQGVIPHVCRCGCKASWITNPLSHMAQPHGPPTSPAPTPHGPMFSRKTDVLMRACLLDCTMLWIQKASHRQLLKLSSNLLMSVVYNIPHKWCVILSCALAFGLPIPRGNSHTATAGVPCSQLPFWCTLSRRQNFKFPTVQRWQSGNSTRIHLEHLSGPKFTAMGRLVMLAHCKSWSFICKVFWDHGLLCSMYLLSIVK